MTVGNKESDPAKAATIAKKFIFADKVAAIIGPTTTGEGMQVKKIVEEAGIPTFMCVGGDPPIISLHEKNILVIIIFNPVACLIGSAEW